MEVRKREVSLTTVLKSRPAPASSKIFSATHTSPAAAEQELKIWTWAAGCSSSHRALAWAAELWEPDSRAERVTT